MITTQLKTSRRTPIANNPRHVPVPIMTHLFCMIRSTQPGMLKNKTIGRYLNGSSERILRHN